MVPLFGPRAQEVLEKRYFLRGANGRIAEDAVGLCKRVARAIAKVEAPAKRNGIEKKFLNLLLKGKFLPNSPTLMNAGKQNGQLSACFVLPVPDHLEGIFESLKNAAMIHQSGGGTGFSFSRLRAKGSRVDSSGGQAAGPIEFMKIFDLTTQTIKQGGTRRGANMGVLSVDHPDILEFIMLKRNYSELTNFNISVSLPSTFLSKLKSPEENMRRELFSQLVESAWRCGDPGLLFMDRMNLFNPTPRLGSFEATNPCGEQPLLPYESCNLGSMAVNRYWTRGGFAWNDFKEDVSTAVRFLDNVIDANHFPIKECEAVTLKNRKIGLGIMGFADLLLEMGIKYGSEESYFWAEKVMSTLEQQARKTSADLAKEKGPFKNYKYSMWKKLGFPPLRNATVSTVAPTGTISLIAGVSSGIEPIFSAVTQRNVLDGRALLDVHPKIQAVLGGGEFSEPEINADLQNRIKQATKKIPGWVTSKDLSVEQHVEMQARFQRFSDSAVSKTINLPHQASIKEIEKAYLLAFRAGCKGITVYRDGCRPAQVIENIEADAEDCPKCIP